jgi:integrase
MNQTSEPIQFGEISKVLGHKNIKTTMIYLYDIVDLSGFEKMRKAISNMNK